MYTYKVVERKQGSFLKGKITTQQLEDVINEYAFDEWILDRVITGETARFLGAGSKDVFLLIFRKEE